MPFVANKIANIGVNEFISGIGTIFISYFMRLLEQKKEKCIDIIDCRFFYA